MQGRTINRLFFSVYLLFPDFSRKMITTVQLVWTILSIVAMLSTAMTFVVGVLLKSQKAALTKEFKSQIGDVTVNSKMSEMKSHVVNLSHQVEVIESRIERIEANAADDRKIIKKLFPDSYQRKTDQ